MVVKKLTFTSSNLGEDVTLMLCFTPPSNGLYRSHFPVAWKVTGLSATGGSIMSTTWAADLAVSSVQVGDSQMVTAGSYASINPGERTNLKLNNDRTPPIYYWTPPEHKGGNAVQARNQSGNIAAIGVGFINDLGGKRETMSPALVWQSVGNKSAVVAEFTPELSAYISSDYQETQIVSGEIQSIDPIWKANLMNLRHDSTIRVERLSTGEYVGTLLGANSNDLPPSIDWYDGVSRLYRATLSFSSVGLVKDTLKTMTEQLLTKGYTVKVVFKGQSTEARIELMLPLNTSCSQAESAMLAGVHDTQYPPPAAIKERSGEIMMYSAGNMSFWNDINPATQGWYICKKPSDSDEGAVKKYLTHVEKAFGSFDIGNGAGYGNGYSNGGGNEFASGLRTPVPKDGSSVGTLTSAKGGYG